MKTPSTHSLDTAAAVVHETCLQESIWDAALSVYALAHVLDAELEAGNEQRS